MADRAACRPRLRVDRVDRTTHSRARDAVRRGGQHPSRNSMDGGNHRANRRHGCGASPMDHSHTTTATATATSLVNFVATNVAICYRRRGNDVDTRAPRTGTSNLDAGHGNLGAVGRARTGWLVDSRHRNCNYRCRDCCGYRIIDKWVMGDAAMCECEWDRAESDLPLQSAGEPDEIESDAETGAVARRRTDAWNVSVQDAEGGGSGQRDKENFLHVQGSIGDCIGSDGHHETFDEVLDDALDDFSDVNNAVHDCLIGWLVGL